MLKILDPIIFPRASSVLPRYAAIKLVTNSGNDVPNATANKEINEIDNPKDCANVSAESIKRWPPRGNMLQPIIKKGIDFNSEAAWCVWVIFVSFFGIKNR